MNTAIHNVPQDAINALTNAAAAILSSLPNWAEVASAAEATVHRLARRLTALEAGEKLDDWHEPIRHIRGSPFSIGDREALSGELAVVIDRYPSLTGEQVEIALERALAIAADRAAERSR